MFKPVAMIVCLILCAARSQAQTCPDFFRFVDFGLEVPDGSMHRGGALFRAEGFDGQPLLIMPETRCLAVAETSKDGRGNPIPVVTAIAYDPVKADLDLTTIGVSSVKDTSMLAQSNAARHMAALERPGATITRGADYLCVDHTEQNGTSCQFASPYAFNAALVVYCKAASCEMPVLAIDGLLVIAATWDIAPSDVGDAGNTARAISGKIRQIHDFLSPLSSLVQR